MSSTKILFLTPYPHDTAGSQRFRFEQYLGHLKEAGFVISTQSFMDVQTWEILYLEGHSFQKTLGVIKGFIRRICALVKAVQFDYVFIHREAAPIGPPIFEWVIAKVLRKKIIYDFDDAIWKESISGQNSLASRIKWARKVSSICKYSYKISVGNEFLAKYARQFNDQVVINPTTINTMSRHLPSTDNDSKPTIGWTGTHSTLKYLDLIVPALNQLAIEFDFDFIVIADKKPVLAIPNMIYMPWSKSTEIDDLSLIGIGVMPLTEDEWSKGKCGFKALQFMALEKPILVSPVGVNTEIVAHGETGFHCVNQEEWVKGLRTLLMDSEVRKSMGIKGRKHVEKYFSVHSNKENFLGLFE